MDWFEAIIGALSGGILTMVSTILYFRPKLKEAKAEAKKAETEASVAEYSHLLERIRTMEELYKQQGELIDGLRQELLALGQEKFQSDQRVIALEKENEQLVRRVDELATEVEAYKIIVNSKMTDK